MRPALTCLWRRHLYVRVWLAVVCGVVIVTFAASWVVRSAVEGARERVPVRERKVFVFDEQQRTIGEGTARRVPGRGIEFAVALKNGEALRLQVQASDAQHALATAPAWRSPLGSTWLMAVIGTLVALGVYPIVRRLTKRLEMLQRGVQRWGSGELSSRVVVDGQDEVADLARHFNAAAAQVEELIGSHKALLANASHEFRSPLARIQMSFELAGERPSPDVRLEIARNIRELDQLLDETLLFSRLDARGVSIGTLECVDLYGLAVEECARFGIAPPVIRPGCAASDFAVRGVPLLLRRALRHLVENAKRYTATEPAVSLDCSLAQVVLRVCDRGPGVPVHLRDRVFEPFYRLPGASERDGGVGLGLALARSIASRHGGSADCEEHAGGGACFVLRLPCWQKST